MKDTQEPRPVTPGAHWPEPDPDEVLPDGKPRLITWAGDFTYLLALNGKNADDH